MAPSGSTQRARRVNAAAVAVASVAMALSSCERGGEAQPPANAPDSSQPAAPEAKATLRLRESDSGGEVEIARGTILIIELPANPTTGHAWSLITSDSDVLVLGEGEFTADDAAAQRLGAGGAESWTFVAQQPGEQELRFEYRRAWERDQPPAKSVSYVIRVR